MNEDYKIMTVSFSDMSNRKITNNMKKRLYDHCVREHIKKFLYFHFYLNIKLTKKYIRKEEAEKLTKLENELKELKYLLRNKVQNL